MITLLLEQVALLREQVRLLTEKTGLLELCNAELEQHNAVLWLNVDAMARKLFGKSSEKLDPAKLQMVFDALKSEPDDGSKKTSPFRPPAARRLRQKQRRPLSQNAKTHAGGDHRPA